ncbi:MAG: zinc-ribbon domain-containing protein [Saccharofermentans sp.]|nr:zinc-ribbon domain-containing protein [Saccharofermentans sp.]
MSRGSLLDECPELIKSWSPNNSIRPEDVSAGSNRKVLWICDKGHEWSASVKNRVIAGSGCPYCEHRAVLEGYNDLLTTNPNVAKSWSPNNSIKPTTVSSLSNKTVLWICSKGHEWKARIADRTAGHGCPYCAGQRVWKGFNDLNTTHPDLCEGWSDRNQNLSPTTITSKNTSNVWWRCSKCGNEFKAVVSARVKGRICPHCISLERSRMRNEKALTEDMESIYRKKLIQLSVSYYASRNDFTVIPNSSDLTGFRIDSYVPGIRLAFDQIRSEKRTRINKYILYTKDIQLISIPNELNERDTVLLIRRAFSSSHISFHSTIEEDLQYIKSKFIRSYKSNVYGH